MTEKVEFAYVKGNVNVSARARRGLAASTAATRPAAQWRLIDTSRMLILPFDEREKHSARLDRRPTTMSQKLQ
ncbi:hypothetical protein tb265_48800 [Gemmatimonadetes bacterium T265]|nr:hypothetical protein tb265_48800 [Gemmatimonadetes bacterium T265]